MLPTAVSSRPTKEETRQQILAVADGLFRQYGFGKTTIADIAQELQMSSANIYKFFASKDAIVEASAERNIASIRKTISEVMRSEKGAGERIEGIVLAVFRFHQELFRNERQIYKMVLQAIEEAWNCVDEYDAFLHATFRRLLEEGMANGEFRTAELEKQTDALLDALCVALAPHLRHKWSPTESEDRVRAHVQFVLRAL